MFAGSLWGDPRKTVPKIQEIHNVFVWTSCKFLNFRNLTVQNNLVLKVGPICLTAAAVSCIYNIKSWNSDIIDFILNSGYNLYMEFSIGKFLNKNFLNYE